MTKFFSFIFVLVLLLTVHPIKEQLVFADTINSDTRRNLRRIERDINRFKIVWTEKVIDLMDIKPGMTILDIGTGTGQFAYEFARRLRGTGEVFATDINIGIINYVKEEAEKKGLDNLYPVLVQKEGLDGFYSKHKYDLITLFHVFFLYEEKVDYLNSLRSFLKEDGRLILILYKIAPLFSSADFTDDFKDLIMELSLEPADSPFYKGLRESTRHLIIQNHNAEPGEALRTAIIEDFNQILSDRDFYPYFMHKEVFKKELSFSQEERVYADWLLLSIREGNKFSVVERETFIKTRGKPNTSSAKTNESSVPNNINKIFFKKEDTFSLKELDFTDWLLLSIIHKTPLDFIKEKRRLTKSKSLATINKLLIIQRFRKYLYKDRMFNSGFVPSIKSAFEEAGYKLQREYNDIIPFEDIIVLTAGKKQRKNDERK